MTTLPPTDLLPAQLSIYSAEQRSQEETNPVSLDTSVAIDFCEDVLEDLLLEHWTGRHTGILQSAMDFVHWHRQKWGIKPDPEVLADAEEEGFTEEEIAAALLAEQYRNSYEESQDQNPLWADYAVSGV